MKCKNIGGDYYEATNGNAIYDTHPENRRGQWTSVLRHLLRHFALDREDGESVIASMTHPGNAIHKLRTELGFDGNCILTQKREGKQYCTYELNAREVRYKLDDPESKLNECMAKHRFPIDIEERLASLKGMPVHG